MSWTSKSSALLAVAASVLVVCVILLNPAGSGRAFAAVAKALNDVTSATWKIVTEAKGPQNETITTSGVGMFLAPSHERVETTIMGSKSIQVFDGQQDKFIALVPSAKIAMVFDVKNLPPGTENPFGKSFLGLRQLVADAHSGKNAKVEQLDDEVIDGRRALRYKIQFGSLDVRIWADPTTLLPIRIEETSPQKEVRVVMTDFQVGVDLDKSLFSLEVPEGYTVQQTPQIDLSKKPITYLADALKFAAEYNDGVFPETLRGEKGIDGVMRRAADSLAKEHSKEGPAEMMKGLMEFSSTLGGALGVLFSLSPEENDWHYAGKDVKLNTPNRPIFWYRPSKSSPTYEVLYADLTVKHVAAKDVPRMPEREN